MNKKISLFLFGMLVSSTLSPLTTLAETTSSQPMTESTSRLPESSLQKALETSNSSNQRDTGTTDSQSIPTESAIEEGVQVEEKENESYPILWELKEPKQELRAGDSFYVKVSGTIEEGTVELPEGIDYSPERNEGIVEKTAFDQKKRKLTFLALNQEEPLFVIFTVTKAGKYKLSLLDKDREELRDPITLSVVEKAETNQTETNKTETNKTSSAKTEATETTTQSNTDETTETEETTLSNTKETPKRAKEEPKKREEKSKKRQAKASDISVDLSAPTSFRTYREGSSKEQPGDLVVSLHVSINKAGLSGTYIEVPYGFIPNKSDSVFQHFTMNEPIFSFSHPGTPAENSIVASYQDDSTNNKLIIRLKDTTTTIETLNLRFKFNKNYTEKIPPNQIVWNKLQANLFDNDGTKLSATQEMNVKSSAVNDYAIQGTYNTPLDERYYGEPNINMTVYFSHNFWQAAIDTAYNNQAYMEIPIATSLYGPATEYFESEGKTNSQDPEIPAGYIRYYQKASSNQSNIFNGTSTRIAGELVAVNKTFTTGQRFTVRFGMKVKLLNGTIQTATKDMNYIVTEKPEWDLSGTGLHTYYVGGTNYINTLNSSSESSEISAFGHESGYSSPSTIKNAGTKALSGISYVLDQSLENPNKVNYSKVIINSFTDGKSVQAYYRPTFVIKDAKLGGERSVQGSSLRGTQTVSLPTLKINEYISQIIVSPMGTDGRTLNSLPPGNAMVLEYYVKNWANNQWPDGSKMINKSNPATVKAWVNYINASNKNEKMDMKDLTFYYVKGLATKAYSYLRTLDNTTKLPGDTIKYQIIGVNSFESLGNWDKPTLTIKLPKTFKLQDTNTKKDFYDRHNNMTYAKSVDVTLVNSDDTNNYYRFQTNNISYKGQNWSFEIPIELKVSEGASAGKYTIPQVVSSSPSGFFNPEATLLPDLEAKDYGYDNSDPFSYSGNATLSSINVGDASKITGKTQARGSSNQSWSEGTIFAVDRKGTPQMRAGIHNTGNTKFGNVRLYNILPSTSDGRGSTGSISFTGLAESNGGTVHYTTKAISDLPSYTNNDLQSWNQTKLTSLGFSTTKPSDMTKVTAIYIDFGSKTIEPQEELDVVLDFLVPDADNQKAINQFQYSAKETIAGTKLTGNSSMVTFSTEFAQVAYHENLPDFLATGVSHAESLPAAQNIQLNSSGSGSITLSSGKPTLPGYTFVEWMDAADNSKKYQPGETINFTSSSTDTKIQLNAVWKANTVKVSFHANNGVDTVIETKDYRFGDTLDLSQISSPTRKGYKFFGWVDSLSATDPNILDGQKIGFLKDTTVYAIWKAAQFTVKFDNNSGEGSMHSQLFTFDQAQKLPVNEFTRKYSTFVGWAKSRAGNAVYSDGQTISNLTDEIDGEVTLYAKWSGQRPVIVSAPAAFDYGITNRSTQTEIHSLDRSAYQGTEELAKNKFTFRVEDLRTPSTNWKLSASLSAFTSSKGETMPLGDSVHLQLSGMTIQSIENAGTSDEKENAAPSGSPSFQQSQALVSGGTAMPLITAESGKGAGTWQLTIPFDEVKLLVPGNAGKVHENYQAKMTWSMDDTL